MIILKILNNNVAVTQDKLGQEVIVMGKGIAYQKRIGDALDEQSIDKIYSLSTKEAFIKFQELLTEIPLDYFDVADRIINFAKMTLGKKLNDSVYISLSDHIFSTVSRFSDGISLKNALLWDIKRFYADEYKVGLKALQFIKESFDIQFPEDEAGFLALHIVNAEDRQESQDIYRVTKIIQEISDIVRYYFQIEFDEQSVAFYRFITHLKFFAQRLISGNLHENESDQDLLDVIKEKHPNAFRCVGKIETYIKNNYNYSLTGEEKLYLTVHIQRVVYKTRS
ncbi:MULTISPECIES: BglG family transcription antiterminator LicT [Paenibacillus]|uniref:Transcription antiterminator LicT n=1 Tax=Paenibacillus amylolyticus TaxID=1451 RepID=A0A1R1C0C8_PAEAM|nr:MULTISPECIES: PRD domain-containing protein [Paenibacillus]OMF15535.1 transcription antiterminator LicT [Paenibacillus amylolyticus]PRA07852.1 transcription antiterminator LicT [Paenibacillus sp. MYb63]PRA51496.1 transcription antiterminator LicT [Paenibacillus sp. MYb67]